MDFLERSSATWLNFTKYKSVDELPPAFIAEVAKTIPTASEPKTEVAEPLPLTEEEMELDAISQLHANASGKLDVNYVAAQENIKTINSSEGPDKFANQMIERARVKDDIEAFRQVFVRLKLKPKPEETIDEFLNRTQEKWGDLHGMGWVHVKQLPDAYKRSLESLWETKNP